MSAFEFTLSLPEDMPSYLAILGLLFCWKLHEVEGQLGRIKTEDVRDVLRRLARARPILKKQRATPWLFIHLSRNDSHSCPQCVKAHLHVFSGSDLREAAAGTRSLLKTLIEKDRQSVLAEPQYYGIKARKTRLLRCLLIPPR